MCLILLAWQRHPIYPLIIVANRDEFYARSTATAEFWPDEPQILAGRDLQAGGTWLGITRCGRFAALTNVRNPTAQRSNVRSRGALVADYLRSAHSPTSFLAQLAKAGGADYNGFNLLVGDAQELYYWSNQGGAPQRVSAGIHGLSNAGLDTPWPKVVTGRQRLAAVLKAETLNEVALSAIMQDTTIHADDLLPATGVSLALERALSAAFIRTAHYGTRSTTRLIIDQTGGITFDEQTWSPVGVIGARVRYHLRQSVK